MKRLPIGIQTFRDVVDGDCVYADKTEYVHKILTERGAYFLSRPRRFGKSLFVDTLREAFSGDSALFSGLYLSESTDWAFDKYPVIRLDMSAVSSGSPDILERGLCIALDEVAFLENLQLPDYPAKERFSRLILSLEKKYGRKVVVLIDEYDKPILDNLMDADTAQAMREVLRGFYSVLKSSGESIHLVFITGVSKFAQASIFSGLNNLRDITLSTEFANICGFVDSDLEVLFSEHIADLPGDLYTEEGGKQLGLSATSLKDAIYEWYDGYSWDGKSHVFNPFSLLLFFKEKQFRNYWFASGTPKFLLDLITQRPEEYLIPDAFEMSLNGNDVIDIGRIPIVPLLFQTGYITVAEVKGVSPALSLKLDMPNYEVRHAFNTYLCSLREIGRENSRGKQ
jgi:hypothetical protein